METMVWNVLWMAAMAAAAMLAGFCMGRLTMRTEVEAAGEGVVGTSNADLGSRAEEEEEGIGSLRIQRSNRRSANGETWLLKAASAARAVVAESRLTSAGGYRYGIGQSRIDRTGRTSRGQRRGLSAMNLVRRGRDSQDSEGQSFSLGSPVSGYVMSFMEGDRPATVIQPMEDKLYAPAAGKITRLFPMGNDFLFMTEFGAELRIRAGDTDDDLLGRYFRPRVVQNEIVAKGKLLLEFDRQSLAAEGASTMVTLSVEHRAYESNVWLTADEEVKTGQELLRIVERAESENVRRK